MFKPISGNKFSKAGYNYLVGKAQDATGITVGHGAMDAHVGNPIITIPDQAELWCYGRIKGQVPKGYLWVECVRDVDGDDYFWRDKVHPEAFNGSVNWASSGEYLNVAHPIDDCGGANVDDIVIMFAGVNKQTLGQSDQEWMFLTFNDTIDGMLLEDMYQCNCAEAVQITDNLDCKYHYGTKFKLFDKIGSIEPDNLSDFDELGYFMPAGTCFKAIRTGGTCIDDSSDDNSECGYQVISWGNCCPCTNETSSEEVSSEEISSEESEESNSCDPPEFPVHGNPAQYPICDDPVAALTMSIDACGNEGYCWTPITDCPDGAGIASALAAGNDAANQSLINLNTLDVNTITGQNSPVSTISVDNILSEIITPYGLGATAPAVAITTDAGGIVIDATSINFNDAINGNFLGSGGSSDSILFWDSTNSFSFGIVWILYSNGWSGGQPYATGSTNYGSPQGIYTAVNSSGIIVSLAFDASTPWLINSVGFSDPSSTGIPDPVSFTFTTQSKSWDLNGVLTTPTANLTNLNVSGGTTVFGSGPGLYLASDAYMLCTAHSGENAGFTAMRQDTSSTVSFDWLDLGAGAGWSIGLESIASGGLQVLDRATSSQVPLKLTVGAGTITLPLLTASTALVVDGSKNVRSSATTSTELGYVSGVTSAIQTQLNNRANIIDTPSQTGTTASISSTNFTNANAAGLYRIQYYLQATTTATTATCTFQIAYTDAGGSKTQTSSSIAFSALTNFTQGTMFVQLASGSISWSTTLTITLGSPQYRIDATCERLK